MDSLLTNYASSDEEERGPVQHQPSAKHTGILYSLPSPKSTFASASPSLFSSLHPPHTHSADTSNPLRNPFSSNTAIPEDDRQFVDSKIPSSFWKKQSSRPKTHTSLFSSLPPPNSSSLPPSKAEKSDPFNLLNPLPSSDSNPKRVVQFRPPIDASLMKSVNADNEDAEEGFEKEKQRKLAKESESSARNSSVKSFLSSLPKPRSSVTLGALPSASGSGRRSILEADVSSTESNISSTMNHANVTMEVVTSSAYEASGSDPSNWNPSVSHASYGGNVNNPGDGASNHKPSTDHYVNYEGYDSYGNTGVDPSTWSSATENYANYYNYEAYVNYSGHGYYENNQVDGSAATMDQDMLGGTETESVAKVLGKRGKSDIPHEIVEVNQDELMKNRPREDQVKLTGLAFGPSYQPVSTKGKPSKLHKRKHQIGSLYYDVKQKEMELAERRAKGFLTKAQTQAKYGW